MVVWLRLFLEESEKKYDYSMLEHVPATIPGARKMIIHRGSKCRASIVMIKLVRLGQSTWSNVLKVVSTCTCPI